jgi:hypothetical protein
MTFSRLFLPASGSFKSLLGAVVLLCGVSAAVLADVPASLLPAFGNEGKEFTTKAKDGNTVKGWLPTDWTDNSEWAPVTATYTKLTDSPDKAAGAVQIKVEKVEEGGQLQLTTYQGHRNTRRVPCTW